MAISESTKKQIEATDRLKQDTDKAIRQALNTQLKRDNRLIDELATFMSGLAAAEDEGDDPDGDPDQDPAVPKTTKAAAAAAYERAVSAQARATAAKREMGKTSRNALIAHWLGDRSLPHNERLRIGESLILQSAARRFLFPVRRYIDGIPRRAAGSRGPER